MPDAIDPNHTERGFGLTAERRLDAVVDILVRGLSRLIFAEDREQCFRGEHGGNRQAIGNRPEVALLNNAGEALMVGRADDCAVRPGGTR